MTAAPLRISVESPLSADGRGLIAASQEFLLTVFGPEGVFSMSAEELDDPGISFYVARDGAPLGCVASVDCGDYVEVKRLFVPPAGRGRGVARALMARLEQDAFAAGKTAIRLETGNELVEAVTLYRALGYAVRGPFGDYAEHPASLFMEKPLLTADAS